MDDFTDDMVKKLWDPNTMGDEFKLQDKTGWAAFTNEK
jgi:hypothetical protein